MPERVDVRELITVTGEPVRMPDPDRLVHLQFRRFAGCPVCNLHLRSVVQRHEEIVAAGIREVVFFHSSADELRPYVADLPFAVVADPEKRVYAEFGVESSPRSLLDPRGWGAILRGVFKALAQGRPYPSLMPHGGRTGLPADFLIASDGRVLASKHGEHVYDQWSVDTLLTLARRVPASGACVPASGVCVPGPGPRVPGWGVRVPGWGEGARGQAG